MFCICDYTLHITIIMIITTIIIITVTMYIVLAINVCSWQND